MSDPHPQGGNLFDMAKDGTKVPEDAAKPNVIPSVARPDQRGDQAGAGGLGSATLHQAADNALSGSGQGEIISAGGALPEDVGGKYSRDGGKQRGQQQTTPHGGRNQPSH
ncbi:uncharacterized protein B0T15DRAFT_415414 [Chaetomium strumarium]|uniref:Uncharacterized protein n=1 Tax=Chaetomium strumarium TaxID=1170767 RepID=A0AAJ0M160_9PEZI|nr:hypothetical protein B0T15DRAFT_415414 [Chaetomium strumarium]